MDIFRRYGFAFILFSGLMTAAIIRTYQSMFTDKTWDWAEHG